MAGLTFLKVVDAGKGFTTVLGDDGQQYTLNGARNWRNNNPGNIEWGPFAKSQGAIGSDGRFAVFPSLQHGEQARSALQFDSKGYRNKTVAQAISKYAPPSENNTQAYTNRVASAAGVTADTRMGDLTPQQRAAFLAAQSQVEGFRPGRIRTADGSAVPAEVAQQFSTPLAAINGALGIPQDTALAYRGSGNSGSGVSAIQQQLAARGFSPGAIDGVKGPNTNAAIRAFQQANGLTVDGIVGPQTRAALATPQQNGMMGRGLPSTAPTFQPGMMGRSNAPIAAPPMPTQRPQPPAQPAPKSFAAQTPPMPQAAQLRLASGKTIAPGVYPSNDGRHQVQISNDGAGNAKITPINNPFEIRGVIDPMREMNAPTLAGALIRAKVPEAMQSGIASVGQNIGNAATGVQNTAIGAVNAIGQGAQGIGSNIANAFSGFGNLFGGHVPAVPASPTFAQMQAMRAVPQSAYMQPRQVAPVPRNRPFFGGVSAPPPVPQQRVVISAPQQSNGGNSRAQQAQDDLRNSGMINSFGMVV